MADDQKQLAGAVEELKAIQEEISEHMRMISHRPQYWWYLRLWSCSSPFSSLDPSPSLPLSASILACVDECRSNAALQLDTQRHLNKVKGQVSPPPRLTC